MPHLREGNVPLKAANIRELYEKQERRGGILETRYHRMWNEFDQRAETNKPK